MGKRGARCFFVRLAAEVRGGWVGGRMESVWLVGWSAEVGSRLFVVYRASSSPSTISCLAGV
jgi:hypothetical protein